MRTITRDVEQPPGGWRHVVEQTGVEIRAASASTLRRRIKDHLKANRLPLPDDFDTWVDDAICRGMNLGAPFCGELGPKPEASSLPFLTLGTVSRFVQTMLGVVRERRFVTRGEAERRYAVCMGCPNAVSISFCEKCVMAWMKMKRMMTKNPLPDNPERRFCASCGCYIRLKVLIPNDILDKAEPVRPKYAPGCWRNQ